MSWNPFFLCILFVKSNQITQLSYFYLFSGANDEQPFLWAVAQLGMTQGSANSLHQ